MDRVEISAVGSRLAASNRSSPSRLDRIAEVRAAIQRGDYETEQRLEGTINRLLEVLGHV